MLNRGKLKRKLLSLGWEQVHEDHWSLGRRTFYVKGDKRYLGLMNTAKAQGLIR